jgi:DNA polymerase-3 subunit delta
MPETKPVVYIFHGEDGLAIQKAIAKIKSQMGDPALAEMNTTRLDGRTCTFEELDTAVHTIPFMIKRRLVILTHPLARLAITTDREKFIHLLDSIEPFAALVLVVDHMLTEQRDQKIGNLHWLERWGMEQKTRAFLQVFPQPKDAEMLKRIHELAQDAGCEISPAAAGLLMDRIGEDVAIASQEIIKLQAYTGFDRSIEVEDVKLLISDQWTSGIFDLVDAIGSRDTKKALNLLRRRMLEDDPLSIFGLVVRQFRLLVLLDECLKEEINYREISELRRMHEYGIRKLSNQLQKFPNGSLKRIYQRLLETDIEIKSGMIEAQVALDVLIAEITR